MFEYTVHYGISASEQMIFERPVYKGDYMMRHGQICIVELSHEGRIWIRPIKPIHHPFSKVNEVTQ